MDYKLKNVYLKTLIGDNSEFKKTETLKDLYEAVKRNKIQSPSLPTTNKKNFISNSNYATEDYNNVIINKFGKIPKVNGNYIVGTGYKQFQIDPKDLQIFQELYPLTPPKAGSTIATKGSGNGEIALYWILGKSHKVEDNRATKTTDSTRTDAPDLKINGNQGIEVKAYKSINTIKLGKFKDDKKNRNLLSILLGVDVLFSDNPFSKSANQKDRPVTVDVFNPKEIKNAWFVFIKVYNWLMQAQNTFQQSMPFINNFISQMQVLTNELGFKNTQQISANSADVLTGLLLKEFAKTKLSGKPGWGGYIANVNPTFFETIHVDENKFNKTDANFFEKNISSGSGEIQISNLTTLFGVS